MTTRKTYRSDAMEALHQTMEGLHEHGLIDKTTMRDFDLRCLTPVAELSPSSIKAIREQAGLSQSTFALALNVTTSLVSKWERGEKRPSGPSLKLLALAKSKGIDAIL